MGPGHFRGGDDFLPGRASPAELNILRDRYREQYRVLRDDRHCLTQRPQRQVTEVVAIEAYRAGDWVIVPRKQRNQGRFPCSRHADDRRDLPRFCAKGNIAEDDIGGCGFCRTMRIREGNAIELDLPTDSSE